MAPHRSGTHRRLARWALTLLVVPVIALAGALVWVRGQAAPLTVASSSSAPAVSAAADTVDAAALLAAVDEAAAEAGGSISVVVLDDAGDQLLASADADQPDYTASLVKLLVVQQLLERDTDRVIDLDDDDLALMARAVEASDDDAMSELWVDHDGAELVTAAAAEFGLGDTAPPEVAGQWGESTTSAQDYATFLAHLGDHLSADDLATLTGWMQSTTGTAADGFDQEFGVLSTRAVGVAAKQGWMCCVDAERQLHSAGILADGTVVVLLGDFPTSTSWPEAQSALDAAATAVISGT